MERIAGHVLSVTYSDADSGFTVIQIQPEDTGGAVTAVGPLHGPNPGEYLELEGEWTTHSRFGRQFQVLGYRLRVPSTPEGIQRYLGAGLIKGIGPELARRIVARFGTATFEVLDNDIGRLIEVSGIGRKRVSSIRSAWEAHRHLRESMLFFQEHDIPTGQVLRILKRYGTQSVAAVTADPYRLAGDIRGFGFATADRIARRLGIPQTASRRVEAGVLHTLDRWTETGHVFCPIDELMTATAALLDVSKPLVKEAMERLEDRGRICPGPGAPGQSPSDCIYPRGLFNAETDVANHLLRLVSEPSGLPPMNPDRALKWVQGRLRITLAPRQETAIRRALTAKVMVLTGGPGTGKTTIINGLIKILSAKKVRCRLAAPTGRAAKRMAETTGEKAATLHRLLEFNPKTGHFQRNESRPIDGGVVIVDEASMMDTVMAASLLRAVPSGTVLLLVGDVHQLPSVGPGNVLGDIIGSGAVPVVELRDIFRQARKSDIVLDAHRINAGTVPSFGSRGEDSDCFFVSRESPEAVADLIADLVSHRIPERRGLHPVNDIQVLTPMNRGIVGTLSLNRLLQDVLNPAVPNREAPRGGFRIGDKVMQVRNNYTKEVFNGDIGRVTEILPERRELTVEVDGRRILYQAGEQDELTLAYAISIHKSQGSEFPAVVIPVLTQHYVLLQRNLIYTAITRGKRLVVLVGNRKALAMAVGNASSTNRCTGLMDRLIAGIGDGRQ
jgi:exodeoxyribonuclease V alpha subunit